MFVKAPVTGTTGQRKRLREDAVVGSVVGAETSSLSLLQSVTTAD